MPTYSKTVRAFLAEETSLWNVVDALSEEMPGHVSAGDLGECQAYLSKHGIDKAAMTIKNYRIAGRFVEESTKVQREAFRGQSVLTVVAFANHGLSQEKALDMLKAYQSESKKLRMGHLVVREKLAQARLASLSGDPEDWTADEWDKFDAKVAESAKRVILALNLVRRGLYQPSVDAMSQLSLIKPADLDAELAALIEG